MKRRHVVQAGLAALALPALAQPARMIRFVPHAGLAVLDPVASSAYVTRNHGFLVWDTLYGIDAQYRAQPQMVAGHTVEDGGLRWTFTLRDGLRFHDGEPVRAADCVASIRRWGARDAMGGRVLALAEEIAALDDRRFAIRLKRPFAMFADALAKPGSITCFVMPGRIAAAGLLHDTDHAGWNAWLSRAGAGCARGAPDGPVYEDFNLLRAAALAGQGVALCPLAMIRDDLDSGRLVQLSPVTVLENYGYYLLANDPQPADLAENAQAFQDWAFRERDAGPDG